MCYAPHRYRFFINIESNLLLMRAARRVVGLAAIFFATKFVAFVALDTVNSLALPGSVLSALISGEILGGKSDTRQGLPAIPLGRKVPLPAEACAAIAQDAKNPGSLPAYLSYYELFFRFPET